MANIVRDRVVLIALINLIKEDNIHNHNAFLDVEPTARRKLRHKFKLKINQFIKFHPMQLAQYQNALLIKGGGGMLNILHCKGLWGGVGDNS